MQKICVLASGGDAPGMNACVKAVFERGKALGFEVQIAVNGLDGILDENFVKLTDENTALIANRTGCVFLCGRCPRFNDSAGVLKTAANLKKHKFDALIVIGGNGSQIAVGRLIVAGVNTVFIPGTIDNDVPHTKHALGFSSAMESAIQNIDALCGTFTTIKRDHIVELMGRGCNELATVLGLASFADAMDMEGSRMTPEQVGNLFKSNRKKGKNSNFVIMQERKEKDEVAMKMASAKYLGEVMKATGDETIRMTTLGFLQRGGVPSCRDRWLGVLYGRASVDCVRDKKFGVGVTLENDKISFYEVEKKPI
jgi:6-phosphofructokinase 1